MSFNVCIVSCQKDNVRGREEFSYNHSSEFILHQAQDLVYPEETRTRTAQDCILTHRYEKNSEIGKRLTFNEKVEEHLTFKLKIYVKQRIRHILSIKNKSCDVLLSIMTSSKRVYKNKPDG